MVTKSFLYDKRIIISTCFLMLIILWAGIYFSFGGKYTDDFVNIMTPLYSLLAVLVLSGAIQTFSKRDPLRGIWKLLFIGMVLVFLGDTNWLIWSIAWGDQIPYPSPGDFFYVSGYVVLCIALIGANRNIQARLSLLHGLLLTASAVIMISLVSFYLYKPILASSDISTIEKILDLTYPTLDIIRMLLALSILIFWGKKQLGLPWLFVTGSFLTVSVTDLLFSLTTWSGVYAENSMLNFGWPASYALMMTAAWLAISVSKSIPSRPAKTLGFNENREPEFAHFVHT